MPDNNQQDKNRNPQQGQLKTDPRKPNQKPGLDETQIPDIVNDPKANNRPRT